MCLDVTFSDCLLQNGTVVIPDVLRPYMDNQKVLSKHSSPININFSSLKRERTSETGLMIRYCSPTSGCSMISFAAYSPLMWCLEAMPYFEAASRQIFTALVLVLSGDWDQDTHLQGKVPAFGAVVQACLILQQVYHLVLCLISSCWNTFLP